MPKIWHQLQHNPYLSDSTKTKPWIFPLNMGVSGFNVPRKTNAMTQAMRLNMKFSGNLGLHVGIHLAWLPYNTFHWSMDWPKEQITGKSLSNGKINGFRFRFSCKPIHWTGASKQPECYMPSQGELNPAAQAIWIVNFQGYQIWGAGDLQTNLYKRSSGGSPWDKPATTIQLQRDFDRINLINDLYIYIYYYIDLY